jgi:hypothetical protein
MSFLLEIKYLGSIFAQYFKPLSSTILQYVFHPENKFDGEIGVLERKHVRVDGVVYIGKEANNIDKQALKVKEAQVFINEEELKNKILALTPKEAREIGIKHRSALAYLKKKAKEENLNFKARNVRKLANVFLIF